MDKDSYFEKSMEYLFDAEGGYSNHKKDRGGATNFGITQNTYNSYRRKKGKIQQSVLKLTKQEAYKIYFEEYWLASGADKVSDFPLALILFDSCVNHGVSVGKALYKKSNNNAETFLHLRREKYKRIVQANPSQKVFYKGWMNRMDKLENFIEKNS